MIQKQRFRKAKRTSTKTNTQSMQSCLKTLLQKYVQYTSHGHYMTSTAGRNCKQNNTIEAQVKHFAWIFVCTSTWFLLLLFSASKSNYRQGLKIPNYRIDLCKNKWAKQQDAAHGFVATCARTNAIIDAIWNGSHVSSRFGCRCAHINLQRLCSPHDHVQSQHRWTCSWNSYTVFDIESVLTPEC